MRNLRHAALAAVLLGMLPSSLAWSADYGGMKYGYPPPPVEIGSGWYMRGDLGYRLYAAPSMTETGTTTPLAGTSAGGGIVIGGGFGYQFSERFRGDLTIDYSLPASFRGTIACNTTEICTNSIGVSAITGMVNAYFDLATIGSFTPYVGAGVGVAMVSTSGNSSSDTSGPPPVTATYPGATRYNLAWALMGGATWEMSPDTLIDLSFRLASLGGASTGTVPAAAGGDGSGVISIGNIIAPEVRLGMRYKID
jgi:opacity protein-like surface antigen